MSRQKLGLQWQAKGEEQRKTEAGEEAQAWAAKAPTKRTAKMEVQVGRPRTIDPDRTERLQVRVDRRIVEELRIRSAKEKVSLSLLVEQVLKKGMGSK